MFISFSIVILSMVSLFYAQKLDFLVNQNNQIWSNKKVIYNFLDKNNLNEITSLTPAIKIGNMLNPKDIIDIVLDRNCNYCYNTLEQMCCLVIQNPDVLLRVALNPIMTKYDYRILSLFYQYGQNNDILNFLLTFEIWKNGKIITSNENLCKINEQQLILDNYNYLMRLKHLYFPLIIINEKRVPEFVSAENIRVAFS